VDRGSYAKCLLSGRLAKSASRFKSGIRGNVTLKTDKEVPFLRGRRYGDPRRGVVRGGSTEKERRVPELEKKDSAYVRVVPNTTCLSFIPSCWPNSS